MKVEIWLTGHERHESSFVTKVFNSCDASVTPELKGSIHNRWFKTTNVGYWGMAGQKDASGQNAF